MQTSDDSKFIKACKLWVSFHGKNNLPRESDIVIMDNEIINIGYFINNIKGGKYQNIKSIVENIFDMKIERKTYFTNKENIEICKKWIEEHGQILPKQKDTIIYQNKIANIGTLINRIKMGKHKKIKKRIEELFDVSLLSKFTRYTNDEYVYMCKKWIKKHGKILPSRNDTIVFNNNNVKLGEFIERLRAGLHVDLKKEIEKLFDTEIKRRFKQYSDKTYVKIFKKWIKTHGKVKPRYKDSIIYNDRNVRLGTLMSRIKKGKHPKLKIELEKLFDCKF